MPLLTASSTTERMGSSLYVISLLRDGEWIAWGSTANKERLDLYLSLFRQLHPNLKYKVDLR